MYCSERNEQCYGIAARILQLLRLPQSKFIAIRMVNTAIGRTVLAGSRLWEIKNLYSGCDQTLQNRRDAVDFLDYKKAILAPWDRSYFIAQKSDAILTECSTLCALTTADEIHTQPIGIYSRLESRDLRSQTKVAIRTVGSQRLSYSS